MVKSLRMLRVLLDLLLLSVCCRVNARCTNAISTPGGKLTGAYGVLFAIETAPTDNVGQTVASLGFHVDTNFMTGSFFGYEVYTLNTDGYYADPERSTLNKLLFDYRGEFERWNMISSGQASMQDLQFFDESNSHYYEIPLERFSKTFISPNAGRKSFYLTLTTTTGLVSVDADGDQEVNLPIMHIGAQSSQTPTILTGEGVVGYPFSDIPYLYYPTTFFGKVLFEAQCTESPSVSIAPSSVPTPVTSSSPSTAPSFTPSYVPSLRPSNEPTAQPSYMPSQPPSSIPSVAPSEYPSANPSYSEEMRSGLLLMLNLPGCSKILTLAEQDSVRQTVKDNIFADAEASGISALNVDLVATNINCERRRLSDVGFFFSNVEFSMILTGKIQSTQANDSALDLGVIAEESINRDKGRFIKNLAHRAPKNSVLGDVQSLEVEAAEAPPEGNTIAFTKRPTPNLTGAPFVHAVIMNDENDKTGLYITVVVVVSLIVFLTSFLLFRLVSRYEIRRHKLRLNQKQKERELGHEQKQKERHDRRGNPRIKLFRLASTRRPSLLRSARVTPDLASPHERPQSRPVNQLSLNTVRHPRRGDVEI